MNCYCIRLLMRFSDRCAGVESTAVWCLAWKLLLQDVSSEYFLWLLDVIRPWGAQEGFVVEETTAER